MLELLSLPSYKPLNNNPLQSLTNKVNKALKYSSLDPNIQMLIVPLNPITPNIYDEPKIHKYGIPVRPIFSDIDGPIPSLSKFLAKKLHPFSNHSSSFIKDSDFIDQIKQLKLYENSIMVSFHVVFLFTKIPIPKTIELVSMLAAS